MRQIVKRTAWLASAVFALVLLSMFHANRRPFIETDDYSVTVMKCGKSIKVAVMKPVLLDDVYYLRLQDSPDLRYHWIVFSTKRQSVADPIGIYH